MITRSSAEAATALATAAFGAAIAKGALEFGIGWDSAGPQPGTFPFYIGTIVTLASLSTLGLTVARRAVGVPALRAVILDREQAKRIASFLLPLVGFVALSATVGMYVATLLYLAFTMRVQGRYGWLATAAVSLATPLLLYLALEKFFQIALLKGPVEAWLRL